MKAPRTARADPLADPAFVIARSLLLCDNLALDEPPGVLARKVQDHARRRFAANIIGASQKDIEIWIRDLLGVAPGAEASHPIDRLYDRLDACLDLEVDWGDSGPIVQARNVRTWLGVLNDFDESFLLCRNRLRGWSPSIEMPEIPSKWRVVTHVGCEELDELLADKATDLHVHLSGMRQAGVAWARVMASPRGWADFGQLANQFESELGAVWRDVAQQAYADRRALCDALRHEQMMLRAVWREPDPQAILLSERNLLLCALARTRCDRAGAAPATPQAREFEDSLWRYVAAKHKFQRATRQPAFAELPGLAHFDERYFRATKPDAKARHGPRPTRQLPSLRSSRGFARADHQAAALVLADDGCLTEVELRISPFPRVADYLTFLKGWRLIVAKLTAERLELEFPKVRFAVHLVRTRRAEERRARQLRRGRDDRANPADQWRSFHGDIARQTAILHRVRIDRRHQDLAKLISRIDVAGQERDTPIELFAPHLQLLRGEERALRMIEELAAGTAAAPDRERPALDSLAHAAEWQRMIASSSHRAPSCGQLALTLHAGEEYADPLEGLFQIWAAVNCSGMKAGEAIGHGLALGDSLDDWCSPFARISLLQDWASLLWLRRVVRKLDRGPPQTPADDLLATLIERADCRLFGERPDAERDRQFGEIYAPKASIPALPQRVWLAAQDDLGIAVADRAGLRPLVELAQAQLRRELVDRKIVIEGNPSSNIRVAGAATLADLPTVALFEGFKEDLQFCINTDNPGTFAASIRTEYAILFQGAQERKEASLRNVDIPKRLRRALKVGRALARRS